VAQQKRVGHLFDPLPPAQVWCISPGSLNENRGDTRIIDLAAARGRSPTARPPVAPPVAPAIGPASDA